MPRKKSAINQDAQWKAYKSLQMKAEKAWVTLQRDVENKAPNKKILEDERALLLILGECNYMTRECMRLNGTE